MPGLERRENVFVLDLGETENRFHPDWIGELNTLLDEVEKADGPRALVTTARGKYYTNGLDLEWLLAHPDQMTEYLGAAQELLARLLSMPVITVAAVQGHAFAAGAMFTLTHDFRVMRADRGYWCLPEVDIQIPFSLGMSALIRSRLTPQTAHEAMTTGRRFGGTEAAAAAIVDHAVDEDAVLRTAVELAAARAAKAGPTLATIKGRLYEPVLAALRDKDGLSG